MKKIGFLLVFAFFLLMLPSVSMAAQGGTHIYLDGAELEQPADAQAGSVKGSVMVPLRVIIENLGYEVDWDKKTGLVAIRQGKRSLQLTVGSTKAVVDGKAIELSAAPVVQGGSTMVPLRFVGEQTGLKVSWNNDSKSAYLYSPDGGESVGIVPGRTSSSPEEEAAGDGTLTPVTGGGEQTDKSTYIPESPPAKEGATVDLNGIGFGENRLMIAVSDAVQPKVFTMSGPDRLVVDIPNVVFSEGFKQQHPLSDSLQGELPVTDYPDVSKIRYSMFDNSTSTIRIVVDLNKEVQYQVNNEGDGLLVVDLAASSTVPVVPPVYSGKPLVVIDPGHGGKQPGATSITNKNEKDFTLALALKVEALLQQESGLDVLMTRTTDVTLSLEDRAKLANDNQAAVFVSIHGNSFDGKSSPTGSETYYSRDESLPLANVMHKHLVEGTGLPDRKVRKKSLHVTRETKMPAVLLEVGYLRHTTDEALMYSEDFQQRVAESIVAGIKEYLGQ
ncbi:MULTISPECIES: N-acetylmuramoyl-L-alanine amidase family protein [Paenibacillus]|uniref:N-acetylmuramoyl-L-alanine amidase family protein n=1 Tax=Paenibacillus TaxID=44249 RepID=UPI002FDFEF82